MEENREVGGAERLSHLAAMHRGALSLGNESAPLRVAAKQSFCNKADRGTAAYFSSGVSTVCALRCASIAALLSASAWTQTFSSVDKSSANFTVTT